jgi:hypothetical protein
MNTNIYFDHILLIFLEWEFFSDKSCTENQNKHFMYSEIF